MNKVKTLNIIMSFALALAVLVAAESRVYAEDKCKDNYGGGKTCVYNKRFSIEKEVRLEGDDTWRDKVYIDLTDGDERDKYIEFKITIKNLSDEEIDFEFNDMKMWDELPDVFDRIGGSGLTEYWDDFGPGEKKTFEIEVEIDEDEIDRNENYERCAVNKASVYWDGEFEGSDTATVCYADEEGEVLGELPKTGALSNLAIAGFALMTTGALIKKSKKVRL